MYNSPAVACRKLTKLFAVRSQRIAAVNQVDLTIQQGKLTMLVGPSGCGKTTLLTMIAGMLRPTEGEVDVLGNDLFRMRDHQKRAVRCRSIGFVFQQFNLLSSLTAAENVAVPLVIAGMTKHRAVEQARHELDNMGLGEFQELLPGELSTGQQQRVAIARAIIHRPRLVICDEPTSALDRETAVNVMEVLRQVAQQPDRAVLVVTHDNRILDYGDQIAEMQDGRITKVTQTVHSR